MKIEDVPQDLKYMKGTVIRDTDYAVDSEGRYHRVISSGWEPKNLALDIIMQDIDEQCQEILADVRAGKASPLAYHAARNLMSLDLLADYAGFSKRTVRKHFLPEYFAQLDDATLAKYADVLRITVEELKTIPPLSL